MMSTPCRICGGAAHPSTGCAYTPTFIVCRRCTVEAWTKTRGLLAHINGKGGRKGLYFYEYATPNEIRGEVMGVKDAARAETRHRMRNGWSLEHQRSHYEGVLEAARVRLEAIADVTAEVEAAAPSRGEEP